MQIKSVAEDAGVNDEDMSKAQKALDRLDIDIEKSTGDLKPLNEILQEVASKWGSMTDVEKQYTSEMLAGNRQRSIFVALMEGMREQQELYNSALESEGALEKANDVKAKSIEGLMNTFKDETNVMWSKIISSDMIKDVISGMTTLVGTVSTAIDSFGSLTTVVGLLGTVIALVKGKAITEFITTLYGCVQGESILTVTTVGLKTAFDKLKLAFISNPIGVVMTALTALAGAMSYVKQKTEQAEEELYNFNQSFNEDYGSKIGNTSNAQDLLNNYKQISSELKTLKNGTNEYKSKEEELKGIQAELATIYPEINDLLKENYDNKDQLINKTQELIDKDKELNDSQAREALSKNNINSYKDLEKLANKYKDTKAYLDSLTKADNDNLRKSFIYWNDSEGNQQGKYFANSKDIKEAISEATKESENYSEAIKTIVNAYQTLDKQGTQYEGLADKSSKTMQELGISIEEVTNIQEDYKNAIKESSDETENFTKEIEKLNEQFDKLSSLIELVEKIKEEIDKYGTISDSTASSILSSGDNELIASMANINSLYETSIKKEQEYSQQKQQNLEESIKLAQAEINATVNATNSKSKQYEIDTVNFLNNLNNKIKNVTLFINKEGEIYKKITDTKGNWYVQDAKNYADALSDKIKSITFYYNEEGNLMKRYVDSKGNWMDIPANEVTSTITTTPVEWNPIKPATKLDDSSSSSSTSSKYDVDNLEDLYDRYLKINTAINKLTGNLDILKEKQDNLVGSKYLKSLQEEINYYKDEQALIKQKMAEESKERWDLRVKLDSAGFKFDDNDINSQILNYESQLKALTNAANAMADGDEKSAEAKKKAQERVKDLNEAIKDYNTLIGQTIPATQKEWEALNNSIKSVYETMSDLVADGESKMYDIFKYYADKRTDKIDEQMDLLDRLHSKETEQEDLASKQSELAKIKEQMNLYELDNSTNGQAKLKELQEQYDELLKEMNTTVKDNQYEGVKQKMEDEKQAIEDSLKPENINKLINDGLVNGFIKIGNQTIQLNDAINDMTSNTTIGFQNMIKEANEYNNALKNAQATLKDIGISSINSNLGYDTSAMTKATTNNNYTNTYNINVEASGLDEQTVSKMILDEIKEYDKTLKV